jgi:hypothetical protein
VRNKHMGRTQDEECREDAAILIFLPLLLLRFLRPPVFFGGHRQGRAGLELAVGSKEMQLGLRPWLVGDASAADYM